VRALWRAGPVACGPCGVRTVAPVPALNRLASTGSPQPARLNRLASTVSSQPTSATTITISTSQASNMENTITRVR
jgi:hypothetical protein